MCLTFLEVLVASDVPEASPESSSDDDVQRPPKAHLEVPCVILAQLLTISEGSGGLPGGLRRKWPDHLSSKHIRRQSCQVVSGECGQTTMGRRDEEGRRESDAGRGGEEEANFV